LRLGDFDLPEVLRSAMQVGAMRWLRRVLQMNHPIAPKSPQGCPFNLLEIPRR
jgi:hypothetical protein